jgi:putative flippase GtrA
MDTPMIARILRFGAVGSLCTFVYLGVVLTLARMTPLPPLANHVLAFGALVPVSYFLQKGFTFRYAGPHRYSLPRFVVANSLAFLASTAGVAIAKQQFGLGEIGTIGIVVVIIPIMSFLTMMLWVFIDPNRDAPAPQR